MIIRKRTLDGDKLTVSDLGNDDVTHIQQIPQQCKEINGNRMGLPGFSPERLIGGVAKIPGV